MIGKRKLLSWLRKESLGVKYPESYVFQRWNMDDEIWVPLAQYGGDFLSVQKGALGQK